MKKTSSIVGGEIVKKMTENYEKQNKGKQIEKMTKTNNSVGGEILKRMFEIYGK